LPPIAEMLDALTAVSLAGSVVQFVEFGLKFCAESREIYHAGSITGNIDLRTITGDILGVNQRLKDDLKLAASSKRLSENDSEVSARGLEQIRDRWG
jgi:hypothetical protein